LEECDPPALTTSAPTEATPPHDGLREAADAIFEKRWASSAGEWGMPEWVETDEPRRFAEKVIAALSPSEVQPATIWEAPSHKTYPCQERPMTPEEAREVGRIEGRSEAADILRVRADDEEDLRGYLALDAAETAIRALKGTGL
jgi:hypothetical protein